jgi:PAS domain S-box-containing protein
VRDLEDRIVYWNQGAADLYGFSAAEAEGHVSHSLLKTVFPSALDEILEQLMREGQWDGDLMHTCRDGRRVIVASHWALHRDAEARVVSILEVNVDITERKAAEEALRVSNAALLRANEDLNQFAFAASHDLQEPLRMITSYSQLLLKGYRGQLDGEASTCIEFITEGNKRMRALLADLLAYTQAAGDVQQAIRPVDLNRVFQTALRNCQTAMDEARAVITSDNLPAIPGYEPHFVQLFQNLISNGLKYRGERPPRIHVSAKLQDGLWRIAIQDNGIGIAPEYHKQIFGVFKRLHGRTIPGTGIGLAICQRVVERYGGQIWVESQVNEGATFYLTLPTAAKGAAAHEG